LSRRVACIVVCFILATQRVNPFNGQRNTNQ
jgi:hypothetical protein